MRFRQKWHWEGLCLLVVLALFATGCGGGNALSSGAPVAAVGGATPPIHVNATRAGVSYTPAQIRHAYGVDQLAGSGAGQTIAIVDAYGSSTVQQDLNTFCQQYSLSPTTVVLDYPTGKPSMSSSGWALETALDVEWAHVIAPAATILLVVARTNAYSDLLAAVDYAAQHAQQVSMSWGGSEFSGETTWDAHFNKAGVSFFASSGDTGAGVEWPAASPYVVGVGGTTLQLVNGTRVTESGWSGSSGGQSSMEREPLFQSGWQSSGARQVPDVSYDADPETGFPIYSSITYNGVTGWFTVGGTSAGAPQWSALLAIANSSRGGSRIGTDTTLYTLGSRATLSDYFYDITSGGNGRYSAGPGYDLVTGLGSPLANTLVPKLISY